jgi:F0F1-type ATP synthase membrane subunit a
VLIFEVILKRFLNFRQASGKFVLQIYAEISRGKASELFFMCLFLFVFLSLANNLFIRQKNKQKNSY